MKFSLTWLKQHLDTSASIDEIAEAMTMAGLEVEAVLDPGAKLSDFTAARIVEAAQHPNADRLRVCQVETKDGMKEIVCGAPNARAGLVTIYAPIGTYVPGLDVTLEARPVRGVVSNGMLCSAAELELADESDGILELPEDVKVGATAAQVFALDPVIDFEVTPNRSDWLGVAGIARDLAASGVGRLKSLEVEVVPGKFPCPVEIRLPSPEACPAFAGRLIRGVKNGPSPQWMQDLLRSVGLRPISALVDVTNFLSFDRCRPAHVYDAGRLSGGFIEARLGRAGEEVLALDGETYALDETICAIADGSGVIGLGGLMGGESTKCTDETIDVFVECAWFDPIRTARAGRKLSLNSDAQYRFARGVDPEFLVPGIELATKLIMEMCGGEPSETVLAGAAPARPAAIAFDPTYVHDLTGLSIGREGALEILTRLGFVIDGKGAVVSVRPPSWRRDVEGKADLVEEVARIAGFAALPSTALPEAPMAPYGVLSPVQRRAATARRAMSAMGYAEAVTWSFMPQALAERFGGGDDRLVLDNPIAADLDCMRPSVLPNLIQAAARNAARGFADAALFEAGPIYLTPQADGQRTVVAAVMSSAAPRRWDGAAGDRLFELKGDLVALLEELGAPTAGLQWVQGKSSPWWHPGRSVRLQLGPKALVAELGELHPGVLKAMDADGPLYAFELVLDALPEPKRKATKTKPAAELSALMPVRRDFAFLADQALAAGELVRAAASADKTLIAEARVFDRYAGPGVPDGQVSLAIEVTLQPREKTLTDAEIEAVSVKVVQAVGKLGAKLRS